MPFSHSSDFATDLALQPKAASKYTGSADNLDIMGSFLFSLLLVVDQLVFNSLAHACYSAYLVSLTSWMTSAIVDCHMASSIVFIWSAYNTSKWFLPAGVRAGRQQLELHIHQGPFYS